MFMRMRIKIEIERASKESKQSLLQSHKEVMSYGKSKGMPLRQTTFFKFDIDFILFIS